MPMSHRMELARDSYRAFAAGDRSFFEAHLSEAFTFSSPPDPLLDRAGWFARCWPAAGAGQDFTFLRLIESGDEVVVTYESRNDDHGGGRNTEIITFDHHDKVMRTEVYFGWSVR